VIEQVAAVNRAGFAGGWRVTADRLQKPLFIEPIQPFLRRKLSAAKTC
jgi:hypothetical protein